MQDSLLLPTISDNGASFEHKRSVHRARILSRLLPSLSDVIFLALLAMLFMDGSGWSQLLTDGQSGTHIKTGEFILTSHTVPTRDLFFFTSSQAHWYAWEWLSDVVFAVIHRAAGLKGVVLFSGAVICLALTLLFRHMIWRGVGVHVGAAVSLVAASALHFHFLARPLIFTTLFAVIALWLLDRDWATPDRRIWMLLPLAALWANLHGGFLVLIVALALSAAAGLLLKDGRRFRRYALLTMSCSAATLANPYGWQLHLHIWKYLRADWILDNVNEFQPPVFRGETMLKAEILLLLGFIGVLELIRRRRVYEALLILFWGHAALTSIRHLTVYVIAAAPAIADQLNRCWQNWTNASSRTSISGCLRDCFRDLQPACARTSIWAPVVMTLLAFSGAGFNWPTDFPAPFPTAVVERNSRLLAASGHGKDGILSADQWGGYLAYRFYPDRRIFIDGRSDYFGPDVLKDYLSLRAADDRAEGLLSSYGFGFVLIPPDWALTRALKHSKDWVLRDEDKVAVLFERRERQP